MNIGPAPRIGALASVALLSGLAYAQQNLSPPSGDHSKVWKIAFDRTRVRNASAFQAVLTDIYVVDSDGKNEKKLTTTGLCHLPNWAPDGSEILFLCLKDGSESASPSDIDSPDQDIGLMASNGDFSRSLRPGIRIFGEPTWLPDGKTIAVENVTHKQTGNRFDVSERGVYIITLNGVELAHRFLQDAAEVQWSPNAHKIAFVAYRGNKGSPAIYVADSDGSGEQLLTARKIRAYSPSWSPDSSEIAFTEWRGNRRTICLATVQNFQVKELTPRNMDAFSPKWSPDGMRLIFSAMRYEEIQLFVINADGSGLRQLTNDQRMSCEHPSWSPDGTQIVFDCHANTFYSRSLMAISSVLFSPLLPTPPASQLYLLNVNAPYATPNQLTRTGGSNPSFRPPTDRSAVVATN